MPKYHVTVTVEAKSVAEVAGLFAYDSDGEPYDWQSLHIEPWSEGCLSFR